MRKRSVLLVQRRLAELISQAEEAGAEAGLHGLIAEPFESMAKAQLRALAADLFGELLEPELVREQIQEAYRVRSKVVGHVPCDERDHAASGNPGSRRPIGWRPAGSFALLALVIGLVATAFGLRLNWAAWCALGLIGALIVVIDWHDLGVSFHCWSCSIQIVCLEHQLPRLERKLNLAQQWRTSYLDVVMGHFEFQRSRSAMAAHSRFSEEPV